MQTNVPLSSWRLQDAKAQFSAVVDSALRGVPQHVTRRGKLAVVVVSEQDFTALQRNARAAAPGFVAHLLAMPKATPARKVKGKPQPSDAADAARTKLKLREVDLS